MKINVSIDSNYPEDLDVAIKAKSQRSPHPAD